MKILLTEVSILYVKEKTLKDTSFRVACTHRQAKYTKNGGGGILIRDRDGTAGDEQNSQTLTPRQRNAKMHACVVVDILC